MTPFQVLGALSLPGAPGLPVAAIPFSIVGQYSHKAEFEFELTGVGSRTVPFGSLPTSGAKCLVLVYEAQAIPSGSPAQPPIALTLNAGSAPIEVSPGGFLALGSPSPTSGLVSASIAHTGSGRVQVWLLA